MKKIDNLFNMIFSGLHSILEQNLPQLKNETKKEYEERITMLAMILANRFIFLMLMKNFQKKYEKD